MTFSSKEAEHGARHFSAGCIVWNPSSGWARRIGFGPTTLAEEPPRRGQQRLTLNQCRKWEALQYGMFIHSTGEIDMTLHAVVP